MDLLCRSFILFQTGNNIQLSTCIFLAVPQHCLWSECGWRHRAFTCHHFHNCFQTFILYIMTRSVLQWRKNIPRIEIHLSYMSSKKLTWRIVCGDSDSLQRSSKTFPPPLTGYTRAHTILLSSDSIKKISGHQTQELK